MAETTQARKFGTFAGVFTPTILTIIGVIMYLRMGWVIGTVGFGAALVIILLGHVATLTTGLSIASIATNTRVGAGGFYAFVSRSLGPEIGGAVGIPLYISQTLSVTLYVLGFTEAWVNVFPDHPYRVVALAVAALMILFAWIGADFALKIQYVIMALILASIVSFFAGAQSFSTMPEFTFTVGLRSPEFWKVFAIFFPAVTGIGAGVAMSGDLKDPRRSLPLGIVSAVLVGLVIYLAVALCYTTGIPQGELYENTFAMADNARWRPLVVAGIMGATLSSALGSIVGGPRILQAIAADRAVPFAGRFSKLSANGTPRNGVLLTGAIVLVSFFFGDLDTIASLLTMFFLISYAMINFTVFIEKAIRIPSFRPRFSVPILIPAVGMLWCVVIMFLIDRYFAMASLALIAGVYIVYKRRNLEAPFGDVRAGIFTALAEWAVKLSKRFPQHEKSWKPNLLLAVNGEIPDDEVMDFVLSIVAPSGSLRLVAVNVVRSGVENTIQNLVRTFFRRETVEVDDDQKQHEELAAGIGSVEKSLEARGIFADATVVDARNYIEGVSIIMQTLKGLVLPPNIAFFSAETNTVKFKNLEELLAISIREQLGVMLLMYEQQFRPGNKGYVNVWLRTGSPNRNLALLTALQLERNLDAIIRLITVVETDGERDEAEKYLRQIIDRGRLRTTTLINVYVGELDSVVLSAPFADINVFGVSGDFRAERKKDLLEALRTPVLFVRDSGRELIDA